MHHIEHSCAHRCSSNWVEGILPRLFPLAFIWSLDRRGRWSRDVRANLEFAKLEMKVPNVFLTLTLQ